MLTNKMKVSYNLVKAVDITEGGTEMKKWLVVISILTVAVVFLTGGSVTAAEPLEEEKTNEITVIFDAGESGAVIGETVMSLECGTAVGVTPEVDVLDGGEFVGWYLKGDPDMRIINVDKLTVYKSITLAAAYQ